MFLEPQTKFSLWPRPAYVSWYFNKLIDLVGMRGPVAEGEDDLKLNSERTLSTEGPGPQKQSNFGRQLVLLF